MTRPIHLDLPIPPKDIDNPNATRIYTLIDQDTAIARGKNSVHSITLFVDVSELSQERRDVLRSHLMDEWLTYDAVTDGSTSRTGPVKIFPASFEGLVAWIDGVLADRALAKMRLHEAEVALKKAVDELCAKYAPVLKQFKENNDAFFTVTESPAHPDGFSITPLFDIPVTVLRDSGILDRYNRTLEDISARTSRELAKKMAADIVKEAQRKSTLAKEVKLQRDAYIATFAAPVYIDMHKAGMLSDAEIDHSLFCSELQKYPAPLRLVDPDRIEFPYAGPITGDEFLRAATICEKLPKDIESSLVRVLRWRAGERDDIILLKVSWPVGALVVTAYADIRNNRD